MVPSFLDSGTKSVKVVLKHSVQRYNVLISTPGTRQITFAELHNSGVRKILVYCDD